MEPVPDKGETGFIVQCGQVFKLANSIDLLVSITATSPFLYRSEELCPFSVLKEKLGECQGDPTPHLIVKAP